MTRGYRAASVVLAPARVNSQSIHIALTTDERSNQIGHSMSRPSRSDALPGQRVSSDDVASQGGLRVTDALDKLAGIALSGDPSAPGGDAYVSLRGLRPGESQTLLDGHPVGPIGIAPGSPDTDGTVAGFNFQDAPYFALRAVDVTFGAGGRGHAGGDSLGGNDRSAHARADPAERSRRRAGRRK